MRLLTIEETPKDWSSNTISYYVEMHKGGAPLRPSDFSDVGFPVIPKKAIQAGNQLIINNPTYCSDEFAKSNKRSVVNCSFTITTLRDLVPTGPTIGTVVNYYTDEKYVLSQGVYGLKLKSSIDRNYFAYMSNTSFYRNVMRRVMVGSTQVHIRTPEYLNLEVQTPPLPEQRKIAKILSTWDKAISTTERLIDNSKQQKKALMQQLLTDKKRLLDGSGKPFEGGWEEVKLGDVTDVRDGTHDSPKFIENGYPLITSKNLLSSGKLDLSNVKYVSSDDYFQINKRSNVAIGDILFGMIGTIGNPVRVESADYAIKNVALLREQGALRNAFLIHYLSSINIDRQFNRLNSGGTQKFIALGVIRNLIIKTPSIVEQQKIATVLANATKEIELLEQQLADLKQEKKALMQQLLTGKRRVKVNEKEVA